MEKKRFRNFVTLHRGATLESAYLIGSTEDPDVVIRVVSALHPQPSSNSDDDIVQHLDDALLTALGLIEDEAKGALRHLSS